MEVGFRVEIGFAGYGREGREDDDQVVAGSPTGPIRGEPFEAGLPSEIAAAHADENQGVSILAVGFDGADDLGPGRGA